jgi:hypothetical protein
MEPFAQVVEAFGGQGVVVVLPAELGLEVAAGGERLASFDDLRLLVECLDQGECGRTKRFLVSMSPCFGRLKSFLATSTPSRKRYYTMLVDGCAETETCGLPRGFSCGLLLG